MGNMHPDFRVEKVKSSLFNILYLLLKHLPFLKPVTLYWLLKSSF